MDVEGGYAGAQLSCLVLSESILVCVTCGNPIVLKTGSHISNYRDNHFNCLFENAAQIRLQLTVLLAVLSLVKATNQKVVAASADLKSKRLMDLVIALAVMYIHVTGPFWQMLELSFTAWMSFMP